MRTKVLFRIFRGDVLALFPAIAATVGDPLDCESYASIGQHGPAYLQGVLNNSRPAKPKEYRELAAELRRIGYKLDIRQRATKADLAERGGTTQKATMNNPKGAPPLDGERASLMLCWRVTPSRKAAYERAAGGQAVCRWAYRVLDGAAKYEALSWACKFGAMPSEIVLNTVDIHHKNQAM